MSTLFARLTGSAQNQARTIYFGWITAFTCAYVYQQSHPLPERPTREQFEAMMVKYRGPRSDNQVQEVKKEAV